MEEVGKKPRALQIKGILIIVMLQFSSWRKATYRFYFHCDASLPRDNVYWMRKWDTSTCDAKDKGNLPDLLITCRKQPRPALTGSLQPLTPHTISNPAESSFLGEGNVYCQQGQGALPLEECPQLDFRAGSFHCKPTPGCTTLLRKEMWKGHSGTPSSPPECWSTATSKEVRGNP